MLGVRGGLPERGKGPVVDVLRGVGEGLRERDKGCWPSGKRWCVWVFRGVGGRWRDGNCEGRIGERVSGEDGVVMAVGMA